MFFFFYVSFHFLKILAFAFVVFYLYFVKCFLFFMSEKTQKKSSSTILVTKKHNNRKQKLKKS